MIRCFFLGLILPMSSLSTLQSQSTDDLQSTIQQQTGKQVEWQKDAEASNQIREAIRVLLRRTLTADAAVQVALLNNRELQATFEEIGIAQGELVEAGLLKNPIFAGNARFPDRSPSGTNIEMSIAQEFFDLLVIPLRKKVAAAQLAKTKLRVGDTILELAAETKTAFYELQAEQQLLGRLKAINETDATAVELAQRQHEAGNINDLDLANQQATYSQSKLDIAQTTASVRAGREKLNRQWERGAMTPRGRSTINFPSCRPLILRSAGSNPWRSISGSIWLRQRLRSARSSEAWVSRRHIGNSAASSSESTLRRKRTDSA